MSAPQKHDVFQAIADPNRRKMLRLLADKELPVTVISNHFPISRTAVSKHLRVLSESNLVSVEKVGREVRYKLNADALIELKNWLAFYEQFWDNNILKLKHLVENGDTGKLKLVSEESDKN